jgi:hypothetical protein
VVLSILFFIYVTSVDLYFERGFYILWINLINLKIQNFHLKFCIDSPYILFLKLLR